ncbi:unnamed protein product [Paramecium pentaurelia]|uniref:Uncharacterized protein n=1 Tax=Paramecium pentaurelia TaxID=43138 RepID=A0A8S1YEC9_9CILI|nr:unnamed protein product [Paramecium pentaurelia]
MQYKFPPRLIEFLNTYAKISLQPIMKYIKVDFLLAKLNGEITNKSNKKVSKNAKCFKMSASFIIYLLYSLIQSESFLNFVLKLSNRNKNNVTLLQLIDFFQEKIKKK